MEKKKLPYSTVEEYIRQYPTEIQSLLQLLRKTILEAAPEATEKISWGMPTFFLHKNLVHFAVCKNHIGFYPADTGVSAFTEELTGYKTTKSGIQFPLNQPLPLELITKIVRFRVQENLNGQSQKGL